MAILTTVYFQDAQGEQATSSNWCNDEGTANSYIAAMKAGSNAQILRATLSTPVPLQSITNNDATAANNETVKAKALVKFRGADLGSGARPFAYVSLKIPAPIGSLINAKYGDPTNSDLVSLAGNVLSASGVAMNTVEYVRYSR